MGELASPEAGSLVASEDPQAPSVIEAAAAAKAQPKALRKGVADELRRRVNANRGIPLQEIEFEVDSEICAPGMFDEPFILRLRACSASQEEQAAHRAGQDPIVYIRTLAQLSIVAINGEKVTMNDVVTIWEALGPAGRTLVADRYGQLAKPDDDAVGKALSTTRVL